MNLTCLHCREEWPESALPEHGEYWLRCTCGSELFRQTDRIGAVPFTEGKWPLYMACQGPAQLSEAQRTVLLMRFDNGMGPPRGMACNICELCGDTPSNLGPQGCNLYVPQCPVYGISPEGPYQLQMST